jgi:hypothetical protein
MIADDATELSTVINAMSVDDVTLSAEQLKALENTTAHYMEGLAAAGSEGAVQYMPGVLSPISTGQLYAVAIAAEKETDLNVTFSGSVTAYFCTCEAAPLQEAVVSGG